jgi:hypothetical protein
MRCIHRVISRCRPVRCGAPRQDSAVQPGNRYNEISAQVVPGSVAALICNSAGWHQTGGALTLPHNMVMLPLPLYAPQLNPMENVWDYLRANQLAAGAWDDYDEILEPCAKAWNRFADDPDRIRSIGTRERATVNPQGGWHYVPDCKCGTMTCSSASAAAMCFCTPGSRRYCGHGRWIGSS